MSNNPLLTPKKLPDFNEVKAEHVVEAVSSLTKNNLDSLRDQLACMGEPSWESFIEPMDARDDLLSNVWSPVSHLNLVMNSDELRKAHEEALACLSQYHTELGQNKDLCVAFQKMRDADAYESLSQAKKTTIEHALRDFRLSGIDLPKEKQRRYGEIKTRLSALNSQFSNNVLDATHGWFYHSENKASLQGLPESIIEAAAEQAKKKDKKGFVLTLDGPVYIAVMTYADDAAVRKTMYEAFSTRASDRGPNAEQWDNTSLIEEILQLRQELATLLGFEHFAALSLEKKMAESTQTVETFLLDLIAKAKPAAEKDLGQLSAWVKVQFNVQVLEPWDVNYYSEKLRQQEYSISQEEVRQYFTLPNVLSGLFDVAKKLFGIDVREILPEAFEQKDLSLWHEDARYFEIFKDEKRIASFYIDLYAREQKRGGAWMDVCRTRRQTETGLQLPTAYLVCNFNAPVGDKPALLTHNDVTTLFHEFGHGLHHMLTQMDVSAVSGINGVEWDAVELPSQFLENWCWQPEVLTGMSSHVESGEPLPDAMIEKMLAAKNFQSGLFLVRQIEFALFDILLHQRYGQEDFVSVQSLLNEVRAQVCVIQPPEFNRFQNSFSHIFAGGYSAGYYSYLWAEVLSADAFSAFEEAGIFDDETGARFYREILSQGGSQNAATLFENFRGRGPSVEALLRHSGIQG